MPSSSPASEAGPTPSRNPGTRRRRLLARPWQPDLYLIDQWRQVRKRTAATMLVQIGRPAIEWLVKEGARGANADEDLRP